MSSSLEQFSRSSLWNNYIEPIAEVGIGTAALVAAGLTAPEIAAAGAIAYGATTIGHYMDNPYIKDVPALSTGIIPAYALKTLQHTPQLAMDIATNAQKRKRFEPKLKRTSDFLKASYETQDDADIRLAKYHLKRDKDLSTMDTKVYYNDKGKAIILNRGTTTLEDVYTDFQIGIGKGTKTKRFEKVNKITNLANKKYKRVDSYGHSLGGFLTQESNPSGMKITHNKATGYLDLFKSIDSNEIDLYKPGDLVSLPAVLTQKGGNRIAIDNSNFNPFLGIIGNIFTSHEID